uniref:F-box associated domain-containing protein n=1 Tax=Oryza glumipatula TaxID=40148 RepID=A0A0E0BBI5_9ORYZ
MFLRDEEDNADVMLVDCKFPTKAHLYVIAETVYGSLIYQVSISDGKFFCHDKVLEPHRSVNSFITKKSRTIFLVGHLVIGIGHTLKDVCIMKKKRWKHLDTSGPCLDQTRKNEISGWAVLNSDTFIVADAKTCDSFILNLTTGEWNVVKPRLPYRCGMLSGRSFCVGGFIYTPWKGGIIAFELVEDGNFYYLGEPILFGLWKKKIYGSWRRISLDEEFTRIALIGTDSDCIVFSIFHGAPSTPPFRGIKHDMLMATVLVKTQTTGRGTKQPISAEHIDLCTSFIEHEGWINPTFAFAFISMLESRGGDSSIRNR